MMTTELDRLKAWMQRNDVSDRQLQTSLRYHRFGTFCKILNGTMPISEQFTRHFAMSFGPEATLEVFGIRYEPNDIRHYAGSVWRPGYAAAHLAVSNAIKAGEVPHPSTQKCYGCPKQAQLFHHESYAPEYHLTVVPLCRSCHVCHHNGSKKLSIAIAFAPEPQSL